MTIHSGVLGSGLVAPAVQSKLNFRIAGIFRGYKVAVGEHVSENQPLATIDAPDQQLAVARARHDVSIAQAGLSIAQAKLDAVSAGPKPGATDEAIGTLRIAQAKAAQLDAQGRSEDVAAKQAALRAAQAKLDQMLSPRPEEVAKARAAFSMAQAKLQALLDGPRPEQVQVWKSQVEQAKDALLAAQLNRDAACASKGGLCDAANAAVNAAQSNVNAVEQQLAANIAPPTGPQLGQAQAEVEQAQQVLAIAQKPYADGDVSQQREAVSAAEQALRLAQKPYSEYELAQSRAAVEAAQGALTQVQQTYSATDRAQAQGAVDQAQAELEWAQASLSNAQLQQNFTTLVAPYAGTVLAENARPGEAVGPDGVSTTTLQTTAGSATKVVGNGVLLLASEDGAEINLTVNDTDLARISLGEPATITFGAFPGSLYHGTVSSVPDVGDSVQNVQQYVVRVRLDNNPGLPQPTAGMTADCEIPIDHQDVLALPSAAILHDAAGRSVVLVKGTADSAAHDVRVETGIADSHSTEILGGLSEGDRVLIGVPLPSPTASQ
jgi:HlyD family secretion protein